MKNIEIVKGNQPDCEKWKNPKNMPIDRELPDITSEFSVKFTPPAELMEVKKGILMFLLFCFH